MSIKTNLARYQRALDRRRAERIEAFALASLAAMAALILLHSRLTF